MKNLFPVVSNLSFVGMMFWLGITAFLLLESPKKGHRIIDRNKLQLSESQNKQSPIVREGKQLFKTNCASCHAKNMRSKLTGPPLGNVRRKWAEFPKEDLYAWIRNSSLLIEKEHPRAVALYLEYNKISMTAFPNLTDEEIESILAYTEYMTNYAH